MVFHTSNKQLSSQVGRPWKIQLSGALRSYSFSLNFSIRKGSFSGCGWGTDDLIYERHCHLETLSLNRGRYLIKTERGEQFANKPSLEKEMLEGKREKDKKIKEQKIMEGPFYNC